MREPNYALSHTQTEQGEVSKVLRNTYGLLGMTLAFSGLVAYLAMTANAPYPNIFVVLVGRPPFLLEFDVAGYGELLEDPVAIGIDRFRRQAKFVGNGLDFVAVGDHQRDLNFPLG